MQPLIDAGERLGRAWGIVGHLHSVMDVPEWREAYNALLPEVSGFYAELGQNLALFAKVKALARQRRIRDADTDAATHRRQRPARLPPFRRRTAGRQEAALQGDPGRTVGAGGQVLREPARRHQRPRRVDHRRGRPERASRRRQCRRAGRRREGRQAGLEIHPAGALVHPGHAVRRQPRSARAHVPRLRDARLRIRQDRMGQRPADRAAC